jgi:hypothetical protein
VKFRLPTGGIGLVTVMLVGCTGAVSTPRDAAVIAGSGGAGGAGGTGGATSGGGAGGGGAGGAGRPPDGAGGAPGDASRSTNDAESPATFWDTSNIPPAQNVLMFKFVNKTNGRYPDSQVFWSFQNQVHSLAEMPLFDMPANSAGRMYFYLGEPNSRYFDFIEFTIDATTFNGNTTRVDAFGLKIAMRLHCADNFDVAVGEDYVTFAEDRAVTFQKFLDEVPAEFAGCVQAPFRIVEPGACGFNQGGAYQNYYGAFIDTIWAANGLTVPKPGPNGSGLGSFPDLSAAIYRHVGDQPGSFMPDGRLANRALWANSATFYAAAPANYYAKFWHTHSLAGKAYGFPYDDVGGYSSFISHRVPQYLIIAIGW